MPKLIGLMLARNEEWIINFTLRVALKWCDSVVVMLHRCEDRTLEIVHAISEEFPGRVWYESTDDGKWHEMFHRHRSLEIGRQKGGTHFAIIDADEALTANVLQSTREKVLAMEPHVAMEIPMIPAWRAPNRHRIDSCTWTRAILSLAFADGPGIRWRPATDGNHFHRRFPDQVMVKSNPRREHQKRLRGHERIMQPIVRKLEPAYNEKPIDGGAIHFQFANWNRLVAKHVWYRMQETVMYPGRRTPEQLNKTYSLALDENGCKTERMPDEWVDGYGELMAGIDLATPSWHLADCKRMMAEHGAEKFAGLDLLGLL